MLDNKRELTTDENNNNKRQKLDSNDNNLDDGINKLPNEILHKIGRFFDKKDRSNFALTNKRFKEVSNDLTISELTRILTQLGFAGTKNNKPLSIPKIIKIHKQLNNIQEACFTYLINFCRQAESSLPIKPDKEGYYHIKQYSFTFLVNDMFKTLYSREELVSFKINWVKIFDNAITKLLEDSHKNKHDNIKSYETSLMEGENQANISLMEIIASSFPDIECKKILELLIIKYKSTAHLKINKNINDGEEEETLPVLFNLEMRNSYQSLIYLNNILKENGIDISFDNELQNIIDQIEDQNNLQPSPHSP